MQTELGKWLWTVLTVFALALLVTPSVAGEKSPIQNKVAVVNGSVITRTDFDREIHDIEKRGAAMGRDLSSSELSEFKKKTLENLIDSELLYQESQRQGIEIDNAIIDGEFKVMKNSFSSEDEFKKWLSEMNLSETELKFQLRRRAAIEQLIQRVIVSKVTVSDKEMKEYYDKHLDFFTQPEQVRASHILIKIDPSAKESQKGEARKALERIQLQLKAGKDFSALAKKYSQCSSSVNGGDLGYLVRGQMARPFEQAAFLLKLGEVSDIVETEFGYHLIKVTDRKPEATLPYKDAKDNVEQLLRLEKAQQEVSSHIAKLKQEARVDRFLTEAP